MTTDDIEGLNEIIIKSTVSFSLSGYKIKIDKDAYVVFGRTNYNRNVVDSSMVGIVLLYHEDMHKIPCAFELVDENQTAGLLSGLSLEEVCLLVDLYYNREIPINLEFSPWLIEYIETLVELDEL